MDLLTSICKMIHFLAGSGSMNEYSMLVLGNLVSGCIGRVAVGALAGSQWVK